MLRKIAFLKTNISDFSCSLACNAAFKLHGVSGRSGCLFAHARLLSLLHCRCSHDVSEDAAYSHVACEAAMYACFQT